MNKFSKYNKNKETKTEEEILYKDNNLQVIKYEDWSIIKQKDCVFCIIYLIDENKILIRQEYIPSFKYKDGQEYHINLIGGGIEKNESPEEALLREIQEEAGIVIRDNFKIEIEKPLYQSKGHSDKCYFALITLTDNDYHEVKIKNDGSVVEDISSTVKLDVKYINSLNVSDIVTQFMIDKMKAYLNIG